MLSALLSGGPPYSGLVSSGRLAQAAYAASSLVSGRVVLKLATSKIHAPSGVVQLVAEASA